MTSISKWRTPSQTGLQSVVRRLMVGEFHATRVTRSMALVAPRGTQNQIQGSRRMTLVLELAEDAVEAVHVADEGQAEAEVGVVSAADAEEEVVRAVEGEEVAAAAKDWASHEEWHQNSPSLILCYSRSTRIPGHLLLSFIVQSVRHKIMRAFRSKLRSPSKV